jgi:hypothetical protein
MILGFQCKAYRNSGTYGSPTWGEITAAKDIELVLEGDEVDVSTRAGGGFAAFMAGLISSEIELAIEADYSDGTVTALVTALLNRTVVEIALMDGGIAESGQAGFRASYSVMSMTRMEELSGTAHYKFKIKLGPSANPPTWMVVA